MKTKCCDNKVDSCGILIKCERECCNNGMSYVNYETEYSNKVMSSQNCESRCSNKNETITRMNFSIQPCSFSEPISVNRFKSLTLYINTKMEKENSCDFFVDDDSSCNDGVQPMEIMDIDKYPLSIFTSENKYSNCSFFSKCITNNLQHERCGCVLESSSIKIDSHSNYIFIYNRNDCNVVVDSLMIVGVSQC